MPIVDLKNEIIDDANFPNLVLEKGEINFLNIDFNYNIKTDKAALKSINLNMPGGKTTALVGPSGSGKSTILNLIPRFYVFNFFCLEYFYQFMIFKYFN